MFVSLTNGSRAKVDMFVDADDVPWSCGYGASLEDLAEFGAYTAERRTADYNPGYDVSPTLYIIGPDGRILWNDHQARPKHTMESDDLVKELEDEIEALLRK